MGHNRALKHAFRAMATLAAHGLPLGWRSLAGAVADDDRSIGNTACVVSGGGFSLGCVVLPGTDALPRPAVASGGFRAVVDHGSCRRLGRAGPSRAGVCPEVSPAVYEFGLLEQAVLNPLHKRRM